MEDSILKSTKKLIGLADDYTAFDLDIITFVNSAFTSLTQLGVTTPAGFVVEDEGTNWSDLSLTDNELGMVKTYIYLKAKLMFDPPPTSFAIEAITNQITEHEWRLCAHRETNPDTSYVPVVVVDEEEVII